MSMSDKQKQEVIAYMNDYLSAQDLTPRRALQRFYKYLTNMDKMRLVHTPVGLTYEDAHGWSYFYKNYGEYLSKPIFENILTKQDKLNELLES